jgi:hypothetical protein
VRRSELPEGLDAINDKGEHISVFATRNMPFGEYQTLLNEIP